jgi:hypothetical protein
MVWQLCRRRLWWREYSGQFVLNVQYCTGLRSGCGAVYCAVLYSAAQWTWCNLLCMVQFIVQYCTVLHSGRGAIYCTHNCIHNIIFLYTTKQRFATYVPLPVVQLNSRNGVLSDAVCSLQFAVTLPVRCFRFVSAGPTD